MAVMHMNLFDQVLNPANRANPYPIYAKLREYPLFLQDDGRYIASTFELVSAIVHDPRFSVDMRKSKEAQIRSVQEEPGFVFQDPPKHDWLRFQVMSKFTPELIYSLRPHLEEITRELLDKHRGEKQIDIVDDLAYQLPITAICELLGVPREDEHLFHAWADKIVMGTDLGRDAVAVREVEEARDQMNEYMGRLISKIQQQPQAGLLSAMVYDTTHEKRMSMEEMKSTAALLFVAGHETTVNLITNGTLTLLRNPESLEMLRTRPTIIANLVEEVLRYEPPIQFTLRNPLTDVEIAGVKIPKGSVVLLVNAAANRDPARFTTPDRFEPERPNIEHFSFGGGIHYCVGAPLARLETQIVLPELARRLKSPRLVVDPPPYRPNPSLRGPKHLLVSYESMVD